MPKQDRSISGFALIETLLVLIIIGIIACVGYWVATQRTNNDTANNSSQNASANNPAAKPGTLSAVDQIIQVDTQAENSIDSKYETADQSSALSANTAAKNLGGAYDESSL